jgi:Uma2 family endonuclease
MALPENLLTAEEYLHMPPNGQLTELVRGRLIDLNMPNPRHGQICAQVAYLLRRHMEDKPLGHVASNDSGVLTQRNPDTVRGADVAFYSYKDVPRGPLPKNYLEKPPRLVFEVLSLSDRWREVHQKVAEYLMAGVRIVCVLDPEEEKAHIYFADAPDKILTVEQELTLPELLPQFRVALKRFFE